MTNKKCEGIDCAWCMSIECPNEKKTEMTDKEQIIEDVKVLATAKSVKKYMRDGCNYSLYCDCKRCKNASWYDDDYCNNERLHFIDNATKTIRVYCESYEVE